MSKPNAWTVAAVSHLNRIGYGLTALQLFEAVPGAESTDIVRKRMYSCCSHGYVTAEKEGVETRFVPTGKLHPEREEWCGARWTMANNMPRVASVFHLAQGVYA